MTRVVSGAVLLLFGVAVVWWAPAGLFLAVAEILLVGACIEYAALARAHGLLVPVVPATVAAALTAAGFAGPVWPAVPWAPPDVVTMSAIVALGGLTVANWRGDRDALGLAAASLFPVLYLGLPIGAMVAIREAKGPAALFLMMLTVFVSDTAQYYVGRALGRRPLATRISPKKTVEGAVGGFLFGAAFLTIASAWWLPGLPVVLRAALGVTVVALGITGDLFESMLKRSAGVKDSSALIPGHGGVLDRIDALLFVAPIYYIVLKYV